ncbi:MAG TPA: class I SAM-dependent methyltransferase [Sulfolobales archaeon]|nr:class I SAM-dependent methyltransferase [Sulfolobales archaeon]
MPLTSSSSEAVVDSSKSTRSKARSSVARLIEFYDSVADLYDTFFANYSPFYREHYLVLKQILDRAVSGIPKGSLIADIGCGTGYWSSYLRGLGYNVIGVDISSRSIGILRSRGLEGIVADARLPPLRGRAFDLAVALGSVVNHIEELNLFLMGVNRILRSGGIVVFDFDSASSIDNMYEALVFRNSVREYLGSLLSVFRKGYKFYWDLGGYYIRLYSLPEVIEAARSSGFKVIDIVPLHTFTSLIPSRISEKGGSIVGRVFNALHTLERFGRILPFSYITSVSIVIILRKAS